MTQAIHEASMERFRPIMMTTLAALMGALPIALGFGADGASRRPLGLVVVGGLIVSQFITLYVTPAIYLYLEEFQEKVLDRTSFFRSDRANAPQPATAAGWCMPPMTEETRSEPASLSRLRHAGRNRQAMSYSLTLCRLASLRLCSMFRRRLHGRAQVRAARPCRRPPLTRS